MVYDEYFASCYFIGALLRGGVVELRHLEHFLAVAEERSFTRAAARVHLVKSALSVSVRNLERELGVRLFDRTTHSMDLTDAGTALVLEARRTLAAARVARWPLPTPRGTP
jgi:DNA-binding transcriptional LysR family regulator